MTPRQVDEVERSDLHAMEQIGLVVWGWVDLWEGREVSKGLSDDVGHKRCNYACNYGQEDGREEKETGIVSGEVGEEDEDRRSRVQRRWQWRVVVGRDGVIVDIIYRRSLSTAHCKRERRSSYLEIRRTR